MRKVLLVLLVSSLFSLRSFSPELYITIKQEQTIAVLSHLIYEEHINLLNNFVRNNNPFNIRYSKKRDWEGKLDPCERGFEKFSRVDYGIKAGLELLQIYYNSWGLKSIEEIINVYAPKHENNTDLYIDYLARELNYPRDKHIPIQDKQFMINFTYYLIQMETGKIIDKIIINNVFERYIT
jgi:hypothetical protein